MKKWGLGMFSSLTKVTQLLSNEAKTGVQACLMARPAPNHLPCLSHGIKQVHISHLMISLGKWESYIDFLKKPQASGQLAFQILLLKFPKLSFKKQSCYSC